VPSTVPPRSASPITPPETPTVVPTVVPFGLGSPRRDGEGS
jgi:hypothetical protein